MNEQFCTSCGKACIWDGLAYFWICADCKIDFIEPDWCTDEDDFGEDEQEFLQSLDECGLQDDGLCLDAGTEYCDFECPYRDMGAIDDDWEELIDGEFGCDRLPIK
jgi:hypothetical protein